MKVVDNILCFILFVDNCIYFRRLRIEFANEGFLTILNGYDVTAFGIDGDIDVKGYDIACIDGFLVDGLTRLIGNTYEIGFVERIKIDS